MFIHSRSPQDLSFLLLIKFLIVKRIPNLYHMHRQTHSFCRNNTVFLTNSSRSFATCRNCSLLLSLVFNCLSHLPYSGLLTFLPCFSTFWFLTFVFLKRLVYQPLKFVGKWYLVSSTQNGFMYKVSCVCQTFLACWMCPFYVLPFVCCFAN